MPPDSDWLLVPGRIIRLFCGFTKPPKEKYVVLLTKSTFLVGFLINSHPTDFQRNRQHLLDELIKLTPRDYSFLSHTCYLDCTTLADLDEEDVLAQITDDPTRDLKMISEKTRSQIISILTNSLTIESGLAKLILKNLAIQ